MCIATLFFLSFFVDIFALLKNVPRLNQLPRR
jgi:hypothetical protein